MAADDAVTHIPAEKVQAAFAKGAPVLETGAFKILAGRREGPGQPEVHARDTDIFYVVEGTATFVTGGQVVNRKSTAQDEERGESITGGEARQLTKGDVIVIPAGVPHVFREVKPPFLYYVVKVTASR